MRHVIETSHINAMLGTSGTENLFSLILLGIPGDRLQATCAVQLKVRNHVSLYNTNYTLTLT
jgi:hypothetical protein